MNKDRIIINWMKPMFQDVPLPMTVFPVQLAKSSIMWNPIIYICMNKSVSVIPCNLLKLRKPSLNLIFSVSEDCKENPGSILSQYCYIYKHGKHSQPE